MLLEAALIKEIDEIFKNALEDKRTVLFEHEVYQMLSHVGLDTPHFTLIKNEEEVGNS